MKKILIDGIATQGIGSSKYHGGGEYAKYYIKEAVKQNRKFDIIFLKDEFIDPEFLNILKSSPYIHLIYLNKISDVYNFINNSSYDTFYSALPYRYTGYDCSPNFIGVIHGLRPLELPGDEYQYKYSTSFKSLIKSKIINSSSLLQKIIKRKIKKEFDAIFSIKNATYITVSNHSKYSILYHFPNLNVDKIKVVYSPFEIPNNEYDIKLEYKDYYLMISCNRFEKNAIRAIQVIDDLIDRGLFKKKIILLGCEPQKIIEQAINHKDYFEILGYVSEKELTWFIANAFCLIYPSLNEGFGYPPLLAMSKGVPVIASSATSIPEATGHIPLLFSPKSKGDLASRILELEHRPELRKELIEKGKIWAYNLYRRQQQQTRELLDYIFS